MIGQSTFFFIWNQKGLHKGGTWVNSLSCFLYGRWCHKFLPTRVQTPQPAFQTLPNLNPSVLRCVSFTLVYVITDTNKSHIVSPQSFNHTVSASVPSLVVLLLAVTILLLKSHALCEGGTLGQGPSLLFLCISHSFLYIARHGVGTQQVHLKQHHTISKALYFLSQM